MFSIQAGGGGGQLGLTDVSESLSSLYCNGVCVCVTVWCVCVCMPPVAFGQCLQSLQVEQAASKVPTVPD